MQSFQGTIKIEIVKPLNASWSEAGARMRTLRRALGPALNLVMSEVHPEAVAEITAIRRGDKPNRDWRKRLEKLLRSHWTSEMAVMFERDRAFVERQLRSKKGKQKLFALPEAESYLPALEYLSAETVDLLAARFTGDHLRDLIAAKSSLPSFRRGETFMARSRACRIEGKASEARLAYPLWGVGKKATQFVVAPSGGHACETWNRLVRDIDKRQMVVDFEAQLKKVRASLAAARRGEGGDEDKLVAEVERIEALLVKMGAYKLGRVGITYDEKKRKWFALVSWTRYVAGPEAGTGKAAAVGFGTNVFMQAVAEDGERWSASGMEILATRERFWARRNSIQRAKGNFGSGAKGRGKKRRELPLRKLEGLESNYVQSKIRQLAAALVGWCVRHGISDLYVEDLAGVREQFEQRTEGDAPEPLKRLIHSWPFYEARLAIEREGFEHGVSVHAVQPVSNALCPGCGHKAAENLTIVERVTDQMIYRRPGDEQARLWKSTDKHTVFKCQKCGMRGQGDDVSCINMLVEAGCNHAMEKWQQASRKRARSAVKRVASKQR